MLNQADEAKPTIKQGTLIEEYMSNIGSSANKGYKLDNPDEAKSTIKQSTLIENYASVAKNNGGYYTSNADEAKATMKQTTLIEDYVSGLSSSTGYYTKQTDEAKPTIKQTTLTGDYISTGKFHVGQARSHMDVNAMETSDARETTLKLRFPATKNISLVGTAGRPVDLHRAPDKSLIGKMTLKDNPSYNPNLGLANKSRVVVRADFEMNHNKNDLQQNTPILDADFIEILGEVLTNNPLVNNLVHKSTNKNTQNTYMFNYTDRKN
jgi:hypothetical protein